MDDSNAPKDARTFGESDRAKNPDRDSDRPTKRSHNHSPFSFSNPAGRVAAIPGNQVDFELSSEVEATPEINVQLDYLRDRVKTRGDMIDVTGKKFAVEQVSPDVLAKLADLASVLTGLPFVVRNMG